MDELEAAGAVATAGLIAGAIERKGGAGQGGGEGGCLNCGAALSGPFCHQCGQPAHISRTLGDVFHDFLHAFLHFDTKAWRTFPLLVTRPGTLTRAYIHGQRARFVSPLAMFLFSVFLMFFVFSIVGGADILRPDVGGTPVAERALTLVEARTEVANAEKERDAAVAKLAEAETQAAAVRAQGGPGAEGEAIGILAGPRAEARVAEELLGKARTRLAALEARAAQRVEELKNVGKELKDAAAEAPAVAPALGAAEKAVDEASRKAAAGPAVNVNLNGVEVVGATEEEADRPWQEEIQEAVRSGEMEPNTGYPALDRKIRAALLNPDLALYKLQETASKFSFLLVLISLPFIAFLFMFKRNVTLFDHVVFSLYSLSFVSVLLLTLGLVARALGDVADTYVASAGFLIPPVHMFFHMKGTYGLRGWSALWRTALLSFFIMFVLVIFALAILMLGVLS
jgi:hypothetical protein